MRIVQLMHSEKGKISKILDRNPLNTLGVKLKNDKITLKTLY